MKILVNALSARRGGGQTYLHHLVDKFPQNNNNKIIILAPVTLKIPQDRFNIHRLEVASYLITNPLLRAVWEILVLPGILKRLDIDILFCPGGSVGRRIPKTCKIVTTFQNMLPFDVTQRRKYPLGYMRFRNWILQKTLLRSMCRSDLVIFISEHARSVVNRMSNNKIKNFVVIPHGVDPGFRRNADQSPLYPSWLPSNGYLLYVSILDVYKAQVEVIRAYALLKRNQNIQYKLVLVGPEYTPYGRKVREIISINGLEDDVLIKDAIPNRELPMVYQNAIVNIFASETENCPFILLEALAAGRPLLVSNRPPMPEFGGDAVIYFDPGQPSDLADKLSIVLSDKAMINDLSAKALEHSIKYNWDDASNKTWDSIMGLLSQQI